MSEPFLGQIMQVGFNFAPRGWSFCDGQTLSISQNTALFSLLGTTFGGDGETTFQLPDLRGRKAIHPGNGPGLPTVTWGQKAGSHTVPISVSNMPSHAHSVTPGANSGEANSDTPVGAYPAVDEGATETYHSQSNAAMGSSSTLNSGGNQPLNVSEPYLGIYHCIALTGTFPSRN